MVCLACGRFGSPLCRECRSGLVAARPRLVGRRLVVGAAYRHAGTAKTLVHALKYRAVGAAAAVLAPAVAELIPVGGRVLVPVPRALNRRLRFGVDPAFELATAVGRLTGLPVHRGLTPPAWRSHHAGQQRDRRAAVRFRPLGAPVPGAVIVDDVITTGATLAAADAAAETGVVGAIVATSAGV